MKFKQFMRMAAERQVEATQDIARAMREQTEYFRQDTVDRDNSVAAAIREQTEYFREDDAKDEAPINEEAAPRPSYTPPTTFVDEHLWAAANPNAFRRSLGMPEVFVVPDHIKQLMRETPHMFQARDRGKFEPRTRSSERDCKLCLLKFGNPVHLIQMAQLPE